MARLDYYEPDDLRAIVVRAAGILGADIDGAGAEEIAGRSRARPHRQPTAAPVRDVAEVEGDGRIGAATARAGLRCFGIDSMGLDKVDRSIPSPRCAPASAADPSACRRWPSRWPNLPRRSKTSTAVPDPTGPAHPHPRSGRHRGGMATPRDGAATVGASRNGGPSLFD